MTTISKEAAEQKRCTECGGIIDLKGVEATFGCICDEGITLDYGITLNVAITRDIGEIGTRDREEFEKEVEAALGFENLKEKLSELGTIQIIKVGHVFTLLLTGPGLSKSSTLQQIFDLIRKYPMRNYPVIEAMRNNDNFFCIVLRPRQ